MNKKRLVQLSNFIGIVSILALLYWTFIYTVIEVNGLKVFRRSITDTFFQSISAIMALMAGSLMINIMLNLTRIAEKVNGDTIKEGSKRKLLIPLLILSFPIIAALLFAGDGLTRTKKKAKMIDAAKFIVQEHSDKINNIMNYKWDTIYIKNAGKILNLISKTDAVINNIEAIVPDTFNGMQVYINLATRYYNNEPIDKSDYIYSTSRKEAEYFSKVFKENYKEPLFLANDGDYRLYYPISNNGTKMILYLNDQMIYGKN